MKSFFILLLHLSGSYGATAELRICPVESNLAAGLSEVLGRGGAKYFVGKPFLAFEAPAEIILEKRMVGESRTVDLNLTRSAGCEFAGTGTGPLSLQFRLETQPGSYAAQHDNRNAWLDLPAPEVRVVAFAEEQLQALHTVAVTGRHDTVRLGTHLLDGKTVNVAVYSKAGAVRRILRLDPNPGTKTWEMAWDAKAQQLHILGHGVKARYWMSAADQLGWEVRIDVAKRSQLETTEGQIRRVE